MVQCNAKTQKGRRCKAAAVKGSKKCLFHGGKKRKSTKRTYKPKRKTSSRRRY